MDFGHADRPCLLISFLYWVVRALSLRRKHQSLYSCKQWDHQPGGPVQSCEGSQGRGAVSGILVRP